MVFIPETGVGVTDANSYIDVAGYKDICNLFEYEYVSTSDVTLKARLVRAAIILDSSYRTMFPGERATTTQGLEWPRTGAAYVDGTAIDEDVVPKEIKIAAVELVQIIGAGTDTQPTIGSSGELIYERNRVEGAVEQERRYDSRGGSRRDIYTSVVDALSRITGGMAGYYDLKIQRVGGWT
jgi:hypothetical protein